MSEVEVTVKDGEITTAMVAAMRSIEAIAKSDQNKDQGFNFRGVDATINAVGPKLREHGIFLLPIAGEPVIDQYQTKRGTLMNHVLLPVTFRFVAADGSYVEARTVGEASDAGDKVVSKAHSVALRIVLLEVFAIPTDDLDPDAESHERAAPMTEQEEADAWFANLGWDGAAAAEESWTTLKAALDATAAGDALDHVKAWLKANGVKRTTLTPDLANAWDEMLSNITPSGEWGGAFEPPGVPDA